MPRSSPAASGPRVVMLTLEDPIGRRILIEARALLANGYDTHVLAPPAESRSGLEDETGIPIERVDVAAHAALVDRNLYRAIRVRRVGRVAIRLTWVLRHLRRALGRFPGTLGPLRLRGPGSFAAAARLQPHEYAFYRRALSYRPDVLHVHDLPLLGIATAIRALTGARVVYDMHEFFPEQFFLGERERARLRAVERREIRETDARFTVNVRLAEIISATYGVDVDVVQSAALVPSGLHAGPHDRLREEYGIPSDRRILLFQGALTPHRNLEYLIEAMPHVTVPVTLVLMGYGTYRATLEELAREHGGESRVVFVEAKEQRELLFYTASADIGLLPYPSTLDLNTTYASPNKVYEYIAARIPILANDLAYVRDVVEANEFGVIANLNDVEEVAHAINTFPYDDLPRFRKSLAERGDAWTWPAEEQKLLAIYDRVLGGAADRAVDSFVPVAPS